MFLYLVISVLLIVILGIYFIFSSTIKTHKKLSRIEYKVYSAQHKHDLKVAFRLLKIIKKDCWHSSLTERVQRIRKKIDYKYEKLKNG